MNTKQLCSLLAAGALTAGVTLAALPGVAGADTPTPATPARSLDVAKARCTAAIDIRLADLTRLDASLSAAKNTTAAHKGTQTASNTAAATGLTSLKAKIASDTDAATVASDCRSIYEGYRVFALRAPQTHLVIAGDAESFAVTKLDGVVPKLSDAIDKAAAAGKDVTAAKAALTDLQAKVADAGTHANGLADSVIGDVPADYNANRGLLDPARANAKAAAADLKAARADVTTILATVRGTSTAKG
jgi:hypothetical protein